MSEKAKSGNTKPDCGSKTVKSAPAAAMHVKGGVMPSSKGQMPTSHKSGSGKR